MNTAERICFALSLVALTALSVAHQKADSLDVDVVVAPLATCSVTSLPTTGTLTASRLNSRFAQVESCINGGIDNTNITANAGITNTKLASPLSWASVTTQLDCATTQVSAFLTEIPAAGTLRDAHVRCLQCSSSNIDVSIQVAATTRISFLGIAGSTLQSSTGNGYSVGAGDEIEVDITVTSAPGTCWLDVTLWFAINHTS